MTTLSRARRTGPVLQATANRLRAAGVATARQDAELLLARVFDTTRLALHLAPERELGADTLSGLEALVARRMRHEPLQYILGSADFLGFRLAVGPGVFIPRPETELLVERAALVCPEGPALALDLCAGSAAVACGLAIRRPALRLVAVELSWQAARWARMNVARLGLTDRVTILQGDLEAPSGSEGLEGRCELVVANPPYISRTHLGDLPEEVRVWEPEIALDGGPEGLAVITRILRVAPVLLRSRGRLLLEIGHDHATALRARLSEDPRYGVAAFHRDLLGYERVLDVQVN